MASSNWITFAGNRVYGPWLARVYKEAYEGDIVAGPDGATMFVHRQLSQSLRNMDADQRIAAWKAGYNAPGGSAPHIPLPFDMESTDLVRGSRSGNPGRRLAYGPSGSPEAQVKPVSYQKVELREVRLYNSSDMPQVVKLPDGEQVVLQPGERIDKPMRLKLYPGAKLQM
jgi:hypothetical protein